MDGPDATGRVNGGRDSDVAACELAGNIDGDDQEANQSMLSNPADVVDAILRMQTQMEGMMQIMGNLQATMEKLIPEQQHFQSRVDVTENQHSLLEGWKASS